MGRLTLDKEQYIPEKISTTTQFSNPHSRHVTPEETGTTHDLISELYIKGGWGTRFHYAQQGKFENKETAILRWERFLAMALNAHQGSLLLDLGSGVGGPALDLAKMTGATILGLDVSKNELKIANQRAKDMGLDHLCSFEYGDFTDLSRFPDNHFDGIFSFQTMCYSADKLNLYKQIKRVLKPGGRFAEYAWGLKKAYNSHDTKHLKIAEQIADNVKCQKLETVDTIIQKIKASGLHISQEIDLTELDGLNWIRPIKIYESSLIRASLKFFLRSLETLRIIPKGSSSVHDFLLRGIPYYLDAYRLNIFTPCLFLLGENLDT